MRLLVDTGVFSAALSRRPQPETEQLVARLTGHQLFLAAQTVAELRHGALVAGWADQWLSRLEAAIATTTVLSVTDELVTTVATLRYRCRTIGRPLADHAHHADLWVAATAIDAQAVHVTSDNVFRDVPGLPSRSKRSTIDRAIEVMTAATMSVIDRQRPFIKNFSAGARGGRDDARKVPEHRTPDRERVRTPRAALVAVVRCAGQEVADARSDPRARPDPRPIAALCGHPSTVMSPGGGQSPVEGSADLLNGGRLPYSAHGILRTCRAGAGRPSGATTEAMTRASQIRGIAAEATLTRFRPSS